MGSGYRSNLSCVFLSYSFFKSRKLSEGEITVHLGDATKVGAIAVRAVYISFSSSRVLVLNNILLIPSFRRNLVSVSKLIFHGYSVSFDDAL